MNDFNPIYPSIFGWNVQIVFEGEIPHHVRPRHRQPQQEVRDLQQLPTQKGKVAGQDLMLVFFCDNTFLFGTETVPIVFTADLCLYA